MKNDPLKPSATLLIKLGSALVHSEELIETTPEIVGLNDSAMFDVAALGTLSKDPEVVAWVKAMGPMLPIKRSTR